MCNRFFLNEIKQKQVHRPLLYFILTCTMKKSFLFLLLLLLGLTTITHAQTTVFSPAGTFTDGIEGPVCDNFENVFIVNYQKQGTIGKVDMYGHASLFVTLPDSAIGNGLVFDNQGNMLVADYVGHRIWSIDTASKVVSLYIKVSRMNQPNDICIAKNGRVYASDPSWAKGTGQLWLINKDKVAMLLEHEMGTSNGLALSPDGNYLYVNESVQRRVWKYTLTQQGKVAKKEVLITFPEYGMDGMKCDVDGNLYIARYGAGVVAVVSPKGKVLKTIRLKGQKPTNIAFGGKDWKTVFVTIQDDGSVETFINDRAGAR